VVYVKGSALPVIILFNFLINMNDDFINEYLLKSLSTLCKVSSTLIDKNTVYWVYNVILRHIGSWPVRPSLSKNLVFGHTFEWLMIGLLYFTSITSCVLKTSYWCQSFIPRHLDLSVWPTLQKTALMPTGHSCYTYTYFFY
jgi:hypothetical protein